MLLWLRLDDMHRICASFINALNFLWERISFPLWQSGLIPCIETYPGTTIGDHYCSEPAALPRSLSFSASSRIEWSLMTGNLYDIMRGFILISNGSTSSKWDKQRETSKQPVNHSPNTWKVFILMPFLSTIQCYGFRSWNPHQLSADRYTGIHTKWMRIVKIINFNVLFITSIYFHRMTFIFHTSRATSANSTRMDQTESRGLDDVREQAALFVLDAHY